MKCDYVWFSTSIFAENQAYDTFLLIFYFEEDNGKLWFGILPCSEKILHDNRTDEFAHPTTTNLSHSTKSKLSTLFTFPG